MVPLLTQLLAFVLALTALISLVELGSCQLASRHQDHNYNYNHHHETHSHHLHHTRDHHERRNHNHNHHHNQPHQQQQRAHQNPAEQSRELINVDHENRDDDLRSFGAKLISDTNQLNFPSSDEPKSASSFKLLNFYSEPQQQLEAEYERQRNEHLDLVQLLPFDPQQEPQQQKQHQLQRHQNLILEEEQTASSLSLAKLGHKFRRKSGTKEAEKGSSGASLGRSQVANSKCSRDAFRCFDGLECVAQSLRCDGRVDCADHSDERHCRRAGRFARLLKHKASAAAPAPEAEPTRPLSSPVAPSEPSKKLELQQGANVEPIYSNLRVSRPHIGGQHLHSWNHINMEHEEHNLSAARSSIGINSFLTAVFFGLGVTGTLVAIVSHKLRSIRRRYIRRPNSVPNATDFIVNTTTSACT